MIAPAPTKTPAFFKVDLDMDELIEKIQRMLKPVIKTINDQQEEIQNLKIKIECLEDDATPRWMFDKSMEDLYDELDNRTV